VTTTTEPPYLHKSTGVAARNGTTTHTINFTTDGDAPFTPATGSLLVFFIFGAVTHTNSAGWTERFQPVNTGELSLFEITSAPTTSITITHNGSNYPAPWVVYELPAGTTYVSGVQAPALSGGANTTDTFPTLSGLTGGAGNERLILAAKGRALTTSGSSLAAATTWGSSFVEDSELNVANVAGSEGASLTTAHLINVIATSVTPTATSTWTTDASWAPDREYVVAAYNAVAPSSTTPFTRDYASTWRVFNAVTRDYASTWRVLNAFAARDFSSNWRVLNALTRDYSDTWRVFNALTRDYVSSWRVLNSLTRDYSDSWRVFNAFIRDYVSTWDVLSGTAFTRDYASTWRVLGSFTRDYSSSWRVLNTFTADSSSTWRVLGTFTRDYPSTWRVLNALTRDYASTWRVYAAFFRDYDSTWAVLGVTPTGLIVQVWSGSTLVAATLTVWNGTTEVAASVESIVP
jgi:hypothetical protein